MQSKSGTAARPPEQREMDLYEDPIIDSGWFDNSARQYRHIAARPLASSMGAEISGVDVRNLGDLAFAEIEDALFRHKMIYFRNQPISHEEQEAFTARFGPVATDAYKSQTKGGRKVTTMIKEANEKTPFIFGGGWHSDSPFLRNPPAITILRSVDTPPFGGDTMWTNAALAYHALSPTMKAMIDGLKAYHSAENNLRRVRRYMDKLRGFSGDDAKQQAMSGYYHPLVRNHPRTGEKALYISGGYTEGFEGLTEFEADYLHEFLMDHLLRHAFTCRLRWEPNMLALWDNRLCLHLAMNDHDGFRREMYRSMVLGEVPI